MKNFAVTGVAGFVAPRHLQAIQATGNRLVAALDPHDSVGILDKFDFDVAFFTEFERFDRHLEKLRRYETEKKVDYLSVCSPNHLHDAHIRLALRVDADVICEKPLVLKPSNLDILHELESESGRRIYNVLQLRHHPAIIELKGKIAADKTGKKHDVVLTYITSRGKWYHYSWKGNEERSGGVVTNIGIHFLDMLMWIFGKALRNEVHLYTETKACGFTELENANVRWYLSISPDDLPDNVRLSGKPTYRSITVNGEELDFTEGFTDLHTVLYTSILSGKGFGIEDARQAIELCWDVRHSRITMSPSYLHPFMLRGR